ncbi:MAG TPA: carboxypeptidase regulatory-like domain-containing protein [Luteimonas sp.]|nr:carboxypeptidase regulatory-like domain-containing protein [Luteimonas sp.]
MGQSARLLAATAILFCASASAADLAVRVDDGHGRAVADAVVTVLPRDPAAQPAPARRAPARRTIDQKDLAFVPYVATLRPGDEVVFHNSDRTRHHVYSFSPVKAFEFVLAPGETSAPQQLDKTGVVAVGCNIHDRMIAYLYVSDAPWIALTDAGGRVDLEGLPAGAYDVRVWQPRLRPGRPDLVRSGVVLGATESKTLAFALPLLPDSRLQFDREHTDY